MKPTKAGVIPNVSAACWTDSTNTSLTKATSTVTTASRGNATAIGVVLYAASFPILLNVWAGVRAVNPLWVRAAGSMGAGGTALFWKVIVPGASPFIITGLRQSFVRAWIAVVGAELLAASDWGLGWVIFDAKEFLQADRMLASLAVIGLIGLAFERLVFGALERATVQRWGMVRQAKI